MSARRPQVAMPRSAPDLIVIDTLENPPRTATASAVLPRVPASLLGLDAGSDPRARRRQPRRRNEAASLPGLRPSSHQLDDHGTVEGPWLKYSQEVVIGRPICSDGKGNRHVDKTRPNE
jgi:hypothetical protein